jgi:ATP-dependent DNA helicase RecG
MGETSTLPNASTLADYRRMTSAWATPLTTLKGVGPKVAERLARKGLLTVGDTLFFLPLRHEDRTRLTPLRDILPGDGVTFRGELISLAVRGYQRRRTLEGVRCDETGAVGLKWFRGNFDWLIKKYPIGSQLMGYGSVRAFRGKIEVHHPELEEVDSAQEAASGVEQVTPVYSEVEGVHSRALRKIMRQAVEIGAAAAVNLLPSEALALLGSRAKLWQNPAALFRELHFPSEGGDDLVERVETCRKAVALEEFYFLQLGLLMKKSGSAAHAGIAFKPDFSRIKPLLSALPFELTGAQRRVLSEIRRDMEAPHPMHRLLQGDVGSGKTLVALLSALMAVESGYQATIMAPTEVLAEQHMVSLARFLEALPVEVRLLTGSISGEERESTVGALATGEVDIVVGTHALIQEGVDFHRLGLVVVDEQHRFGVRISW